MGACLCCTTMIKLWESCSSTVSPKHQHFTSSWKWQAEGVRAGTMAQWVRQLPWNPEFDSQNTCKGDKREQTPPIHPLHTQGREKCISRHTYSHTHNVLKSRGWSSRLFSGTLGCISPLRGFCMRCQWWECTLLAPVYPYFKDIIKSFLHTDHWLFCPSLLPWNWVCALLMTSTHWTPRTEQET